MPLPLLFLLFLPLAALTAQTDSLLRAAHWAEDATPYRLLLTPDGTFQQDYGPDQKIRYLMGRYAIDPDHEELTLSVDYYLGKSRIPARYRREQDFYLVYAIDTLTEERLVLRDLLTDERRRFSATPLEAAEDPALRRVRPGAPGKLKLPPGWGGRRGRP